MAFDDSAKGHEPPGLGLSPVQSLSGEGEAMIPKRLRLLAKIFFLFLILAGAVGLQDQAGAAVKASRGGAGFPHITSATRVHMGCPDPMEIAVWGSGFTPKLNRSLRVDTYHVGSSPTDSSSWFEDRIIFRMPGPYIPWEHVYQFAINAHGQDISNVYSTRFLYYIEKASPGVVPAGQEAVFTVFMLPDSQGQLMIKIGILPLVITGWQGGDYGEIKARIPAGLTAGEYEVYLQKGNDVVSDKFKLRVVKLPIPKKIIK
jgi:hypothetical protein